MKITVLPKTLLGYRSICLAVIFVFFHFLLSFSPILRWAVGVATIVTGLIGIIRNKERAILVFLAVIVTPLVFLLLIIALTSGG